MNIDEEVARKFWELREEIDHHDRELEKMRKKAFKAQDRHQSWELVVRPLQMKAKEYEKVVGLPAKKAELARLSRFFRDARGIVRVPRPSRPIVPPVEQPKKRSFLPFWS